VLQSTSGIARLNRHRTGLDTPTRTSVRTPFIEPINGETNMQWTTPTYTDMRFGFEITLYIATR